MRKAAAALLLCAAVPAWGADLSGPAAIIDADSLMVGRHEIRLHGIDAPEWKQECELAGRKWLPGQEAAAWLRSLAEGKPVACAQEDRDRHGRTVATCYLGGVNLNEAIVRAGWAFAYRRYSDRYVAAETQARAEGAGLWRGQCDQPEAWRRKGE